MWGGWGGQEFFQMACNILQIGFSPEEKSVLKKVLVTTSNNLSPETHKLKSHLTGRTKNCLRSQRVLA
jgi:hypothetical protein